MGRPRKACPRYLEHKQSDRGRAVWTDAAGKYHDILLPGPFGWSPARRSAGCCWKPKFRLPPRPWRSRPD